MDAPLPLLLLLAPSFLSPATGSSFAREGWEGRGSQPQGGTLEMCVGSVALRRAIGRRGEPRKEGGADKN